LYLLDETRFVVNKLTLFSIKREEVPKFVEHRLALTPASGARAHRAKRIEQSRENVLWRPIGPALGLL